MDSGHNPAQLLGARPRTNRLAVLWAALATLALAASLLSQFGGGAWRSGHGGDSGSPPPLPAKRNVIFMVSDGMGPASLAMARNFYQHTHGLGLDTMAIDDALIGNSRTQSSNSFVTDSAAGATAFACALKTYNGAIAVDADGLPCATVLEAAKHAGYRTGLVVTTRITDATPASFAAHAHDRSEEDFIAEQLVNWDHAHPLGPPVDLMLGGGRCHFLPRGAPGSCRGDDRDLLAHAAARGWHYINSTAGLRELDLGANASLPLLGLFAPGDLPFSIDYPADAGADAPAPRLNETALTAAHALAAASQDSEQGFFLLVEGSRIDHAGHSNDPGAQVREVLAYSDAFAAMQDFARNSDVPTIVVSTSDHETGGLAVARQTTPEYPDYLWRPEVLARAKHSTEYLARELRRFEGSKKELLAYIQKNVVGRDGLGLEDVTDEEIEYLAKHRDNAQDHLARMQSWRAQIGWSTHGHSAVDVNVYGASNHREALDPLRGPNENTGLGRFMQEFLGFDRDTLANLTVELRRRFGDKFPLAAHSVHDEHNLHNLHVQQHYP